MAENLFKKMNPSELKREINDLVAMEKRSLPHNAKVFAAIAHIQGFDAVPDVVPTGDLQKLIDNGQQELLRGMTGHKGTQVAVFAGALLKGTMYPGTLSAIGSGIHFAPPSQDSGTQPFPRESVIALEYAAGEYGGAVVRASIDPKRATNCRDLLAINREFKGSARKAGIDDVGALAAAYGLEAFFAERHYDNPPEDVWVVLNRGALTFQNVLLLVKPTTV